MHYCSIIDKNADLIKFAAGPTLTKSINDLRRFLVSHELPRESPLVRALHGLCLAGWGEPTANLLPYYPNGSPNDGREQTPPSQILSAFFPQYLRASVSHLTKLALKKAVKQARITWIVILAYPISRLRPLYAILCCIIDLHQSHGIIARHFGAA